MKSYIHHSQNRGHVQSKWLNSYHSFSFGNWYDPNYLGVNALRVINEDIIAPRQGFNMHSHDNMEILTYVLSGSLYHKDSMGNEGEIHAGEWQLMSAGTGIRHSETNKTAEPVHLLQIWLLPNVQNTPFRYQQIKNNPKDQPNIWCPIVQPHPSTTTLQIQQEAKVSAIYLEIQRSTEISKCDCIYYLHVISGEVLVNGNQLITGDAYIFNEQVHLKAQQNSHLILFQLSEV